MITFMFGRCLRRACSTNFVVFGIKIESPSTRWMYSGSSLIILHEALSFIDNPYKKESTHFSSLPVNSLLDLRPPFSCAGGGLLGAPSWPSSTEMSDRHCASSDSSPWAGQLLKNVATGSLKVWVSCTGFLA